MRRIAAVALHRSAWRRALTIGAGASRDPWATLGIPPTSDLAEAKVAFRKLALTLHPDVSGDAESVARFAEVVSAYEAIADGDVDAGASSRISGSRMRGVRVVGGILVASIDQVRRDANYQVHTIQLALEHEQSTAATSSSSATAEPREASSAATDAISTETVHVVRVSEWDSVGDLRRLVQEQLGLPAQLCYEHAPHSQGGHEFIAPGGVLLGEHLFISDYALKDGDVLHFAVNLSLTG